MDINDLFDGIMKSINQFAEGRSCTSCASWHSNIPREAGPSGREAGTAQRNAENFEAKEKWG